MKARMSRELLRLFQLAICVGLLLNVAPRCIAIEGLPVFQHKGVVLDYKDLKYNPCNDVIIPSVIKAYKYFKKPLGRYYMYYAPHDAPGGICVAYADSPEGPWKEYANNPLIKRAWEPHHKVSHVSGPHAIWNAKERKLFLYYHGENDVTHLASSVDGINFKYECVAVTTKMFNDISEASYARIFDYRIPGKDNRYIMLFMGNNKGTRKIYLAWSKDGRAWEAQRTPFMEPQQKTGQLAQAWLFPWKGKHYIIFHDYTANGTDLHVSEVDAALQKVTYLGVFYDHKSVAPDNVAQMSPCFLEEKGKWYLYSNIGPRLHQKVALAIAEPKKK